MEDITRRNFVKGTGLAAGGLLLANPFNVNAFHNVQGSDRLKLAIVGCGGRGTGAVRQALKADDGVELVAMADAFEDQLKSCHKTLTRVFNKKRIAVPDENMFTGFGAYKKAIDLADVVILTTPPGFRPQHFEYAIQQGKHVFMEKPVATDAPGIRRVLEAAKQAKEKKLNVVVGLQRHYQDSYREIYSRIQNGELGKIMSGQVYWNSGGVWVRKRKPGMTEMEYQMRNWYYFNWLCGDHILEQHIHNIDVANWFLGENPISAQGMGGRQVRNGIDHGEIFDHHFVEFKYASGAVISSQCRHIQGCYNNVSESFQGTKGTVFTDGSGAAEIKNLEGQELFKYNASKDESPYQIEHNELFASIRAGEVINNVEYGAKSTMTAIMGRMATYSGKLVTWEEALNSNLKLVPDEDKLTWNSNPPSMPDENGLYEIPVPGKTKAL